MATEEQLPEEKILKYGLKIKLLILNCHLDHSNMGHSIAAEFKSNLDYCVEGPRLIFEQIEKSKFLQYSTLIIIINGYCLCSINVLAAILYCIRENKYLRYKSKLIILNNVTRCPCHRERFKFSPPIEKEMNCGKYDNVVIFLNNVQSEMDISQCFLIMLMIARSTPLDSIQKILKPTERADKHEVIRTSTNADLYFYTINPALAIIVNNNYFTSPHTIREGSDVDVVNLMRELKIARIPYILIEDCDRSELLKILDYIEKKDFQPLKSFLFFLMSHGDSENIIYTHDGQLDANTDVVNRIQSNKSLENAEKLIVLNKCRGGIDLEYADFKDMKQIKPTDGSHLKKNTMVLYSVPNGVQSPRCPERGCPLISSFCHNFRNIDHTDDIRVVNEQIEKDLKQEGYFESLKDKNCSELLLNDVNKCHYIMQLPTNAVTMIELIDSILSDFPTFNSGGDDLKAEAEAEAAGGDVAEEPKLRTLFYICGTLNEKKFPKVSIVKKYFAAELDSD